LNAARPHAGAASADPARAPALLLGRPLATLPRREAARAIAVLTGRHAHRGP